MKKPIYSSYLIFLILLALPISCTTQESAKRGQNNPPVLQENSDTALSPTSRQDATPNTVMHAEDSADPLPQREQPFAETCEPAAAAHGLPEASVSRQKTEHELGNRQKESLERAGRETTLFATASISPETEPAPLSGETEDAQQIPATEGPPAPEASIIAIHTQKSEQEQPEYFDTETMAAANREETITEKAAEPAAAADSSGAETTEPAGIENAELTGIAGTETAEAVVEEKDADDEETLAELISDFEAQGGSHGYEPPISFHEEMMDLFSPQIFTVALSKEPESEQKVTVSRMVAVEEKQRLELTYPGHGWVYIGEQTAQQGLKYEQRKLEDNNSIFMFTAEKKGDYILHFSYFDVFTNDFITDAVAVSVSAARSTAAKSLVRAPDYKSEAASSQPQAETTRQAANGQQTAVSSDTVEPAVAAGIVQASSEQVSQSGKAPEVAGTAETVENIAVQNEAARTVVASETADSQAPDQLLEKARTAIAAADADSALRYLDSFFAAASQNLDEGLLLKGKAYELNGSARNIRFALDAYKALTAAYPQSKYWTEADARIRYITHFYITIQ